MGRRVLLGALCALFSFSVCSGEGDILIDDPKTGTKLIEGKKLTHREFSPRFFPTPNGNFKRPIHPTCSPNEIKKIFRKEGASHFENINSLRNYIQSCEKKLKRGRISQLSLVSLLKLQANLSWDKNIKQVIFHLSDGTKIEGLIGIKPGNEKRPMILTQCGLSCRGKSDYSNSLLFMHVFHETPFNVISLGSTSDNSYSRTNDILALGGIEEGRHMIEAADLILSEGSFLKNKVSSLHAMGFSLGGGGLFFGALFDELNPQKNGQKRFSSALAMCPVVDLKASIHSLTYDGFFNFMSFKYLKDKAKSLRKLSPYLEELTSKRISKKRLTKYFGLTIREAHEKLHNRGAKAYLPFTEIPYRTVKEMYSGNNFLNYSHLLKTPTLVLSAKNDIIVRHKPNAKRLLQKHQNSPDSPIQIVTLNNGSHCAYSYTYGWETISKLGTEFFLRHSPEFSAQKTTTRIPLNLVYKIGQKSVNMDQSWKFQKDKKSAELKLTISSYRTSSLGNSLCTMKHPFNSPSRCHRTIKFKIPLTDLPVKQSPSSIEEANYLTRIANINWKIVGEDGLSITGTNNLPAAIVVEKWP